MYHSSRRLCNGGRCEVSEESNNYVRSEALVMLEQGLHLLEGSKLYNEPKTFGNLTYLNRTIWIRPDFIRAVTALGRHTSTPPMSSAADNQLVYCHCTKCSQFGSKGLTQTKRTTRRHYDEEPGTVNPHRSHPVARPVTPYRSSDGVFSLLPQPVSPHVTAADPERDQLIGDSEEEAPFRPLSTLPPYADADGSGSESRSIHGDITPGDARTQSSTSESNPDWVFNQRHFYDSSSSASDTASSCESDASDSEEFVEDVSEDPFFATRGSLFNDDEDLGIDPDLEENDLIIFGVG
ncbi:hypothetical protein B0H13DRAFT_1900909 [Mycena leptocephala]|nr:hypothetical protein B0H13DRAFT_1900909 [Mycena leptocephala]